MSIDSATAATLTDDVASKLGEELRAERDRRDLTQAEMATLLEVPLRTYQKWENTDREPDNPGPIRIALRCLAEHRQK